MSNFTHLMVHCSDTPKGRQVKREDIEKWHLQERGWSRVGYSALFEINGNLDILIPFDRDDVIESWEISNGARGWNGRTRHICYAGGRGGDTRTGAQMIAMETFVKMHVMLWPDVKLIGHNQVNSGKNCPGFDVRDWAYEIGIADKHIDYSIYY